MKRLLLLSLWLGSFCAFSQSSNLVKYWKYRYRLDNEFLVKGQEDPCKYYGGLSVPVSERNGKKVNHIKFGDNMKDIGWYVGVLSTEYLLLSAGKDYNAAQETLKDLYMAMKALERFDAKAEWQASPKAASSCSPLNGFLVRDETANEFFTDDNGKNFKKLFPSFSGTPVQGTNYNTDLSDGDPENHFSVDHMMSILMGYALVRRCLPPQLSYNGYNFYNESYQFTNRIMRRMAGNSWINVIPNTPSTTLSFTDIAVHGATDPAMKAVLIFAGDGINTMATAITGIPNPIPLPGKYVNLDKGYEMLSLLPGWVGAANYMNPDPVTGPYTNNVILNAAWQEMQMNGKLGNTIKNMGGYRREMIFTLAAIANNWEVCVKQNECYAPYPCQVGCNVWVDVDPCFGAFGGCKVKECLVPAMDQCCAGWVEVNNCLLPKKNNTLRALCDFGKEKKQEVYALLHMFLYNKRVGEDWWMPQQTFEQILTSAPCEGPRFKPADNMNDLGTAGWRASNRWEKTEITQDGSYEDNSGYYNGLDYMLTFNLYMLTYGNLMTSNGVSQYTTSRGNYMENEVATYPISGSSIGSSSSPYTKSVIKSITSTSCVGCATAANVTYTAGNDITLKPGFVTKSGSTFKATISPYLNCNGPHNYRLERLAEETSSEENFTETMTSPSSKLAIQFYPNPATDKTTFQISSPEEGAAKLVITDPAGNVIGGSSETFTFVKGTNAMPLDVSKFKAGVYTFSVQIGASTASQKLVVVK